MSDTVITIENLSKLYRLGEIQSSHTIAEAITKRVRRAFGTRSALLDQKSKGPEVLWALKDVSFSVERGDVLGVIGRNGAGKSTLLKILSRITEPTTGRVVIEGRIGSLLEVGTGFHPELTGRENVYLNGAILGMSPMDITLKFDEIVEFSEISNFIDTPVKRYSSGMYTRLAFAVAAHLDSPILIVDEVLSVGDAAFQKKCLGKIDNMTRSGRTVVFVSHNMGAVSELCSKAILLHEGQLHASGPTSKVIEAYVHLLGSSYQGLNVDVDSAAPFSFVSITTTDGEGRPIQTFDIADPVHIVVTYRLRTYVADLTVAVLVSRNMTELFYAHDCDEADEFQPKVPGLYRAVYRLPGMFLKAGSYSIRVDSGTTTAMFQQIEYALTFDVEELSLNTRHKGYTKDRPGLIVSPGRWTTTKLE